MQTTNAVEQDKFEIHLDLMVKRITSCQEEKNLKTCSNCESYFGCETRDDYVKSVYNSMSKGDTGGFEF